MQEVDKKNGSNIEGYIGISNKFAVLNRLITRDLNNDISKPTFSLYTKTDIQTYLSNPYTYEKQLRKAVTYIYGASSHFRRLIQYFAGLNDCSYVVEPYRVDPKKANIKTMNNNYRKVLNMMSSMNIKTQLPKILTVCLRDDVFYGTLWVTNDNITIQQLPSDYCSISTIEGSQIMKPMTVARHEFVSALTEFINNSQLPAFVLEAVLKDFYTDIKIIAQQQLENDLKRYGDAQKKAGDP